FDGDRGLPDPRVVGHLRDGTGQVDEISATGGLLLPLDRDFLFTCDGHWHLHQCSRQQPRPAGPLPLLEISIIYPQHFIFAENDGVNWQGAAARQVPPWMLSSVPAAPCTNNLCHE